MTGATDVCDRCASFANRYWKAVAAVLFVLVSLDMVTTLRAAAVVGIEHEANPVKRWALEQGRWHVVGLNVLAATIAIGLFYALKQSWRGSEGRFRHVKAIAIDAWLLLLFAAGVFVVVNNVFVIVFGASLL